MMEELKKKVNGVYWDLPAAGGDPSGRTAGGACVHRRLLLYLIRDGVVDMASTATISLSPDAVAEFRKDVAF